MAIKPLIYDIGAHTGEDTQFYLNKGFKVVAVEALPKHVEKISARFRDELRSGDLTIEPVAIGLETKKGSFLVHSKYSEWNRENFDPHHPSARIGIFKEVEIDFVRPIEIFQKYEIPYYVKVDIEGNDWIVIKAISDRFLPKFVSFEECNRYPELLYHLHDCGYRSFQILDQSAHHKLKPNTLSHEGRSVRQRFKWGMTGPFGFDLPECWVDLNAMLGVIPNLPYDKRQWYDFHASIFPNELGRLVQL